MLATKYIEGEGEDDQLMLMEDGVRNRGVVSEKHCANAEYIPYSEFLSREKTFANFAFLWRFANVFSAKIYINYFQAIIRYRVCTG